jgi:hypothetical protein
LGNLIKKTIISENNKETDGTLGLEKSKDNTYTKKSFQLDNIIEKFEDFIFVEEYGGELKYDTLGYNFEDEYELHDYNYWDDFDEYLYNEDYIDDDYDEDELDDDYDDEELDDDYDDDGLDDDYDEYELDDDYDDDGLDDDYDEYELDDDYDDDGLDDDYDEYELDDDYDEDELDDDYDEDELDDDEESSIENKNNYLAKYAKLRFNDGYLRLFSRVFENFYTDIDTKFYNDKLIRSYFNKKILKKFI